MSKVLIFSHNCISSTHNNGKTLKNIFSEFSRDQIGQLYISDIDTPDFSVCKNYFKITDRDILFLKSGCEIENVHSIDNKNDSSNKGLLDFDSKFKNLKILLRNFVWSFFRWHTNSLKNWLKVNKFDVLFFVGGNYSFSHKIARKIASEYSMKLVTFFTDDYILNASPKNVLEKLLDFNLRKSYNKTIKESVLLFCIGDLMCNRYSDFYKRKFHPIMNCVDFKEADYSFVDRPVKISYVGGLHLGRWESLCDLARILGNIIECQIDVYSFSNPSSSMKKEFMASGVSFKGSVEGAELENVLRKSTILVHVESYLEKNRALTSLSVSTKIPEYLMFTRPILALGPKEVASIRLIKENHMGIVIDLEQGVDYEYLRDTLGDKEVLKEIAHTGYNYAVTNFSRKDVSQKLKIMLNNVTIQK